MIRKLTFLSILAAIVLALSAAAFGQRTTGDLEGTVKDPKGAVVPGVSVTVQGVSVGYSRTVQTNAEGLYKILNVPQGTYKVTTAPISGFGAATVETTVVIEKTSVVDIALGIGSSVNVVQVENDPMGVQIDTTDSKVQTTITRALMDKLPTGASFTSLLKISPGTRPEPLSGGFQVDGASGSENTFVIDGQPMENFRTGTLNGVNNIPTSLVSEIQIKTGGFEAEHGGASGGVIAVATKSG
ncbi:MAG TPA: carboxypeptidase regulatory-like domain-containing protein, partial [Pyrinomonadaceae bacterium]|nr:carboxypeptidase regulatory-like domain-containing protein [Pyrinomonadaceae bacterium]